MGEIVVNDNVTGIVESFDNAGTTLSSGIHTNNKNCAMNGHEVLLNVLQALNVLIMGYGSLVKDDARQIKDRLALLREQDE